MNPGIYLIMVYGRIINENPATYWNDRISFIPHGLSGRQLRYYRNKIAVAIKALVSYIAC